MFSAQISRLFHCGTLLVVFLLLPAMVASQDRASVPEATVKQVLVRETTGAIEVEIQTSAPVAPNTQAITGPDRIVVDFPGAQPSAQLRKLKVNRGTLKGVRSGLFFSNPPITRVVLDLTGPQAYQILSAGNSTIVKFAKNAADEQSANAPKTQGSRFTDAALTSRPAHLSEASVAVSGPGRIFSGAQLSSTQPSSTLPPSTLPPSIDGKPAATMASDQATEPTAPMQPPTPPAPAVTVTYEKGMLSIHADKATLSQVLYEVQLRTQAEIAIPAGAEQEKVVADLGPAPARDVLSQLLNGSAYNFIFVGEELALQRVILTRRAENFSSLP
jgi:hypothetical protein